MSVECECGKQVEDGQRFCRRCGSRIADPPGVEDEIRKPSPPRPASATPPSPNPPPVRPTGGGGPNFKVIAGVIVAILVLAVGGYALTSGDSDRKTMAERPLAAGSGAPDGGAEVRESDEEEVTRGTAGTDREKPTYTERTGDRRQGRGDRVPGVESMRGSPDGTGSGSGVPSSGYIAQLGSFPELAKAESSLESLKAKGAADGILWSSDYPDMSPGYWVVFAGPFDSVIRADQAAASSGIPDAFSRWISRG